MVTVIHGRMTPRDQLEKSAVTRRNDALCEVTQVGAHMYSSIPYEVRLLSRFLLLLACTAVSYTHLTLPTNREV